MHVNLVTQVVQDVQALKKQTVYPVQEVNTYKQMENAFLNVIKAITQ